MEILGRDLFMFTSGWELRREKRRRMSAGRVGGKRAEGWAPEGTFLEPSPEPKLNPLRRLALFPLSEGAPC